MENNVSKKEQQDTKIEAKSEKKTGNTSTTATLYKACSENNLALVETCLKDGQGVDQKKKESGREWTPLMIASTKGHKRIIKILLEYGAKVDLQTKNGWTALLLASQNGHTEIVQLLHEYGAQVDLQRNSGGTALMSASLNGHTEVVKLLHEYGAQVDLQKNDGWTALMSASQNGHTEVVKLLHEYGAQVDLQRNDGCTALMLASENGHTEVIKLLHEYGAQVDLQKKNGWTALMSASQNGHTEVVKLLHEYGAQVDLQRNDGCTALMLASQNGHTEVIKLLHEYGAQVDLQKNDGWTALMSASRNGLTEVVKLLHEYGAQVDLQKNGGYTALMLASQNGHTEVVKLLHEYGAQVDLQRNSGGTALMSASLNGHTEVVKLLHEYGAQIDLQKNNGWTALMMASQNGHTEVVKLLHEYGAQVDLQKNDVWTALMSASQNGHTEIVKLLHEYGAQVDLKMDGWTALMLASQNGHTDVVKFLQQYNVEVDPQINFDINDSKKKETHHEPDEVCNNEISYDNNIKDANELCDGNVRDNHKAPQNVFPVNQLVDQSFVHTSKVKFEYDINSTDDNSCWKEPHREADEVSNNEICNDNDNSFINGICDGNSGDEYSCQQTLQIINTGDEQEGDEEMNILRCDQNGHPECQEHNNNIIVSNSIEVLSSENEQSIAPSSEDNVDSTTSHCSAENEQYHRVVESNSNQGALNFESDGFILVKERSNDKSIGAHSTKEHISNQAEGSCDVQTDQITNIKQNEIKVESTNSTMDKSCCMNVMLFITIFIILVVLCLVGMAILLQRGSGHQCQLGK